MHFHCCEQGGLWGGGDLVGGSHSDSEDEIHLSEGHFVVRDGQQSPLSPCHSLPVSITVIHSQNYSRFLPPRLFKSQTP